MPNYWKVNIKDSRDPKNTPNGKQTTKDKIDYCKNNNIIAIGWAVGDPALPWDKYRDDVERHYSNKNDKKNADSFKVAADKLESMKKGDIVLVNPIGKDHRVLCRISDDYPPKTINNRPDIDIGTYREVSFIKCLPKNIMTPTMIKCFPRRAVEQIRDTKAINEIINLIP